MILQKLSRTQNLENFFPINCQTLFYYKKTSFSASESFKAGGMDRCLFSRAEKFRVTHECSTTNLEMHARAKDVPLCLSERMYMHSERDIYVEEQSDDWCRRRKLIGSRTGDNWSGTSYGDEGRAWFRRVEIEF